MKIEKYSEFDKLNENIWQNVKYGLSKLGRYKASGKIFGKKKVTKNAEAEVEDVLKNETNKLLKQVYDQVKKEAPEFPNDRKKITFLRGVINYGKLYDSLVAAAKKSPKEEGYLSPDVCNEIIEGMRKVIKKFLDVDLKAVYTVAESKDEITDDEIFELNKYLQALNEEEGVFKKIGQYKDKMIDKLFGAEKGTDAPEKKSKGQSAKLQKTSGQTNVESERMKTLASNKLPLILIGAGAALGTLGWLAKTEWMKNLIMQHFGGGTTYTGVANTHDVVTNITGGQPDSKGLVHWMSEISKANGGGNIKTAGDITDFMDKFGGTKNMSGFFIGNGGGDPMQQAQLLQQMCSENPSAGVWEIFTEADKTAGTMHGGQNLFGISKAANFVAKVVKKQITTAVIKSGGGAGAAMAAKVAGIGSILLPLGIALVTTGLVVKLLREKGKRQSRAKTLNDLLQSAVLINTTKKSEENVGEKSIYSLMIKNLTQLRSLLATSDGVKLEDEGEFGEEEKRKKYKIGGIYTYTNKKGEKHRVKLISLTNDMGVGVDKAWLTRDDVKKGDLEKGMASVIYPDKKGQYSSGSPEMAVPLNRLSESIRYNEDKQFGTQKNVKVTKAEDYLTQAITNIRKSLKSLKDEKDKGIGVTYDFISAILDKKLEPETKEPVKLLYKEIYEYLYGNKSATLSDLGPLYRELKKESVETIANKSKRQIVAEKIARFSKRSLQFENEGFYGGMGEFGADMQDYNASFRKIMEHFKPKEVKETKIYKFRDI